MKIIEGRFDPVTSAELSSIKSMRKSGEDIFVKVVDEGILSLDEREKLLRAAVAPYRHIHIYSGRKSGIRIAETDEDKVRNGYFYLSPVPVVKIMLKEGCYFDNICRSMCNPRRCVHSYGVAETGQLLAEAHHLNEKKAYQAGLLHDITKAFSFEENRTIISIWKPEWLNISEKVWHSYTAVVWIRQNMCMHDNEILHAIEHHTLGDGRSNMDHILYIADKIEPNRGYDVTKQKECALQNLKKGAQLIQKESREYIWKKEGIHV